jgi:hypothetical protein
MRLLLNCVVVFQVLWLGLATASCNADNCARAVTGTDQGLQVQSSHKQDCSSFFRRTSTPTPVTETVTATYYPQTVTQTAITSTGHATSTVYSKTATLYSTTSTQTLSTTVATIFTTVTSVSPGKWIRGPYLYKTVQA